MTANNGSRPLSFRKYAKHRGCSVQSVSRAAKTGRLRDSLVMVRGKAQIGSIAVADREWTDNTDLSKAPTYVKERAARGTPLLGRARSLRPDGSRGTIMAMREERPENRPTALRDTPREGISVLVWHDAAGDHVTIFGEDPAIGGDEVDRFIARLTMSKDVAANLALRIWIETGGSIDDLPGVRQ